LVRQYSFPALAHSQRFLENPRRLCNLVTRLVIGVTHDGVLAGTPHRDFWDVMVRWHGSVIDVRQRRRLGIFERLNSAEYCGIVRFHLMSPILGLAFILLSSADPWFWAGKRLIILARCKFVDLLLVKEQDAFPLRKSSVVPPQRRIIAYFVQMIWLRKHNLAATAQAPAAAHSNESMSCDFVIRRVKDGGLKYYCDGAEAGMKGRKREINLQSVQSSLPPSGV
jgi:hypothetical protein